MILQRSGTELLESNDAGVNWTPVSLAMKPFHGKLSNLHVGEIQRIYASPAGWFVKMGQRLWFRNDSTATWNQIALRLPAPVQKKTTRTSAPHGTAGKVTWNTDLIAFAEKGFFLASQEGVLRCSLSGSCTPLKAFASPQKTHVLPQNVSALQASPDGQWILAIVSGKLGISQDAGGTAVWHDLPPDSNNSLSSDVLHNLTAPLFLATTTGLFRSTDGGEHWIVCRGGLPAAPVGHFLRGEKYLFATLRDGGLYASFDQGATWQRLEQDAEHGNFAAIVETSPGVVLLASQSEGLLRWSANRPE
jgi:photosystem II stability/assembly factor-like uncharacterized protein